MADQQSRIQRVQKIAVRMSLIAALAGIFGTAVVAGPALACEGRAGEVGCDGEERRDGEDNQDDNSDTGEEEQTDNTPEPRKGDTRTEYRYTECVPLDAKDSEGHCRSSRADSCPEGENFYWVDERVWTYDGSQWTYDESVGDNGWEVATAEFGCRDPEQAEDGTREVTEDMVIRAFNSRPLPSGEISANPPNGRTLVSFDTIFYTEQGQEEFNLPLHEIDQSVQIIATPVSYNWDFGDGNSDSWDTKGQKWEDGVPMSEYNTYSYSETGTFQVELTIDYEVQFNDGSGWQTISEPITSRPSDPFELQVEEKRNRLRDGN